MWYFGTGRWQKRHQRRNQRENGNEDTRGCESKKKRNSYSSDSNQSMRKEEMYLVGKISVTQTNRIFKELHVVGKFTGGKLGAVRSQDYKKWDGYH